MSNLSCHNLVPSLDEGNVPVGLSEHEQLLEMLRQFPARSLPALLATLADVRRRLCPSCGALGRIETSRSSGETRLLYLKCHRCNQTWKASILTTEHNER